MIFNNQKCCCFKRHYPIKCGVVNESRVIWKELSGGYRKGALSAIKLILDNTVK